MKHKVKLMGVRDDIVTLKVDGMLCSYLIQRPLPLGAADMSMLKSLMDTRLLESLFPASNLMKPQGRLARWFLGLWGHKEKIPLFGETVADYIEKVGVRLDIDAKTEGVFLLRYYVDKIREDRIYET